MDSFGNFNSINIVRGDDVIDFKARMKNKTFWISLTALCMLLAQQLGFDIPIDISGILNTILSILVLCGIIVDPSTEGFTDKNNNGIDDREEGNNE